MGQTTPVLEWTTSGWLYVTPQMRQETDTFDQLPTRPPFGLWIADSFWDIDEDHYELSLTHEGLWGLPDLDTADIWEHPELHRALYLTATEAGRTRRGVEETLYSVLDSVPVRDLMVDPTDSRYGRLRELLSRGGHDPWEPALDSPERARAAAVGYQALHGYGFGWIEWECTGTNDFYVALALRPYVGQFEGWDQSAYDALRRSFEHYRGELLHPEDASLADITYEKSTPVR